MSEGGETPRIRSVRATAAAVIRNPWIGTGPTADLGEATRAIAPDLARILTDQVMHALGGAQAVEAFGKAALVGAAGELEHGAALIHTPYFGNLVREFLHGESVICFSDDRGAAGSALTVPMWHKVAATTRSHYQTVAVRVPDAPRDDEIVVVVAASTGPRPHPRIGDRSTDPVVTSQTVAQLQEATR